MAESLNQKNPNRVIALLEERLSTPFGGAKSEILDTKIRSMFPLQADKVSRKATDPKYPIATSKEIEEVFVDPKNQALLNSPKLLGNINLGNRITGSIHEFNLIGSSRFSEPTLSRKASSNYEQFSKQVEENTARYNSERQK